MKKTNTIYWISTGLFAALMLISAIPDALKRPDAIEFMTKLGYPLYFISFIGVIKIVGVFALLVPGLSPWIKEWAYAGFTYDLMGAIYSIFAAGLANAGVIFMLVWIIPLVVSYMFYHKKLKAKNSLS